jgi:ribosomal protein S18 acetylase RimI-like enzyme
MVEIVEYNDSMYEQLKDNLEHADLYDPDTDTRETLQKMIERDSKSILVAVDGGSVVGSVYLFEHRWESFIFRLAVKPEYRNQGIGSSLMREAEKILKDRDAKYVSLFIRIDDENRLVPYYQKLGYKPATTKYHKVMWKGLQSE